MKVKCCCLFQPSVKAITALVKAMLDLEMVAIVRKVQRKNTAPRIGVLFPICEEKAYVSKCIILAINSFTCSVMIILKY